MKRPRPNPSSYLGWSTAIAVAIVLLCVVVAEAQARIVVRSAQDQGLTFQVQRADPETQDLLTDLGDLLDRGEWTQAFRMMDDLRTRAAGQLIERGQEADPPGKPRGKGGTSGVLAPVDEVLRQAVLELPASGRDAFVLFYDGQAQALERRMREARPGSDEQASLAGQLVDRFLVTRSGAAGAEVLGDVMYERGRFVEAARAWSLIEGAHPAGPAAVGVDPAGLAVKRALVAARLGEVDAARTLEHRLGGGVVTLAGRTLPAAEAVALVQQQAALAGTDTSSGGNAAVEGAAFLLSAALPDADASPLWRVDLVDARIADKVREAQNPQQRQPQNGALLDLPPTCLVQGDRLYGNWLGVCFAVDTATGRMLWRSEPLSAAVRSARLGHMMNRGLFHPQRFTLTHADDRLLAVGATMGVGGDGPTLTAYAADTGRVLWTTQNHNDLRTTAFLGPVLIVGDEAVAVTSESDSAALDLRGLDLQTGAPVWSLRLGEVMANAQYGYGNTAPPLPAMVRQGATAFIVTGNGATLAVDLPTRRIAWVHSYEAPPMVMTRMTINRNYTQAPTLAWSTSALLIDHTLYVKEAGGRRLYALDPGKRDVIWETPADPGASLAAATAGQLFLIENRLQAIDRRDATLDWAPPLRGMSPMNNPVVTPEHLLVCSRSGVSRIRLDNGREEKSFDFKAGIDRYARREPDGCGLIPLGEHALLTITSETLTAWPLPERGAE